MPIINVPHHPSTSISSPTNQKYHTMAKFRLLDLVKPFQHGLPEIENPVSKAHLSFDDRMLYSIGIAIFFVFSQLPIYSVTSVNSDPFYQFRPLFAAERGTLDEFGLLPIITAGFFWQFLSGFRLINVNFNVKSDRGYFQSLQKLTAIFLGGVYAFALVFLTDYYNPTSKFAGAIDYNISSTTADAVVNVSSNIGEKFLIWFQLFVYNFLLTMIVEILDKDYGFTSGSLFLIGANVSVTFMTGVIDFTTIKTGKGYEYRGVFIQLFIIVKNAFGSLFSSSSKSNFFYEIVHLFNRSSLVNLKQVLFGVIAATLLFYLQAFHQAVPIKSKQIKTQAQSYPVKLFFNGALPIIFAYSVLFNLKIFSYVSYKFLNFTTLGSSLIAIVIAQFESSSSLVQSIIKLIVGEFSSDSFNPTFSKAYQTSGIASYFQAPTSFTGAILNPINTVVYSASLAGLIMFFALSWTKMSGSSGKDVADFFSKQNITILGKRDANVAHYFNKIINNACISGGLILAALAVIFDFLGCQGLPTALVVSILIIFNFLESFFTELQQSGGSSLYNTAFGGQDKLFGQ
ncbi:hypothetical protein DASC09_031620 [Saccharomycopsis crataegensis]|uniref:Translocon Sec61/SecY plug domain-containing protein n=1 Tax=Saccharomycopsis crataegensis TaxID=43959 RepID=A0AAV5QMJ3_9ASCO|nr:hypothetical protein DASC09_031620 [Saccharomycopsis crataegensis]